MMKRLLLFLMVVIVVTVAAPLSVSAVSPSITDDEVENLLKSAAQLFDATWQNATPYVDSSADPIVLERNGRKLKYLPAKSEYSDFSYWENFAKSIYTDEVYPYALELGKGTENTLGLLINHNGKAYFLDDEPVNFSEDHLSIWFPDNFYMDEGNYGFETVSDTEVKAKLCGCIEVHKYIVMSTTMFLYANIVKTDNGWRISKGTLVDLFAPNHKNEKSGQIWGPSKFEHYPFMYRQIAEFEAEKFLSAGYGKDIDVDVIEVIHVAHSALRWDVNSDNEVIFPDGHCTISEVIMSSKQINNNIPFVLYMCTECNSEKWVVDFERSAWLNEIKGNYMEFDRACEEFGIDQTPIADLYNSRNPDTADVAPSVVAACVFLLMLSVLVDKRKWIFG